MSIIPIILSGGSGTRLWPLSRKQRPKQFIPLFGNKSLFQNTLERLSAHVDIDQPLIVCNEEHRFMVAEQLREIDVKTQGIILEPIGRNTAPAIALAALYIKQLGKADNTVLISKDFQPKQSIGIWIQRVMKKTQYPSNDELLQEFKDKYIRATIEEVEMIISYNLAD